MATESKPDFPLSLDSPSGDPVHADSHKTGQPAAIPMQRKKLIHVLNTALSLYYVSSGNSQAISEL